jgi:hypothetical protein
MAFSTQKQLLGWLVDTQALTIALPPHRLENMTTLLNTMLAQRRTSTRKWKQLLGTLRSTTPALYGANHLFSILQHALIAHPARVKLTSLVKTILRDWLALAASATHTPVPIHTVVPRAPTCLAATDASSHGFGGFWTDTHSNMLWRLPLSPSLRKQLITPDSPGGTISNSDLELAAIVMGSAIAAHHASTPYQSILLASDNTPAIAWTTKGSATSNATNAFLLHQLARQRRHKYYDLVTCYTPGPTNLIADACSRLFMLSDPDFLAHMNQHFPVQPSWTLAHLPNELICELNSALLRQLQPLASLPPADGRATQRGISGRTSASRCTATPTWPMLKTPYHYSNCLHTDTAREPWLPVGLKSALAPWKEHFVPWDRRSPHWDNPTPASPCPAALTYAYPDSCPLTKNKTHPQHALNPYRSPSSHKQ